MVTVAQQSRIEQLDSFVIESIGEGCKSRLCELNEELRVRGFAKLEP